MAAISPSLKPSSPRRETSAGGRPVGIPLDLPQRHQHSCHRHSEDDHTQQRRGYDADNRYGVSSHCVQAVGRLHTLKFQGALMAASASGDMSSRVSILCASAGFDQSVGRPVKLQCKA